jgi:hypothetical protein
MQMSDQLDTQGTLLPVYTAYEAVRAPQTVRHSGEKFLSLPLPGTEPQLSTP